MPRFVENAARMSDNLFIGNFYFTEESEDMLMRRKKLLAGLLIAALLVGSASPAGVMGAEVPEKFRAERVMIEETERHWNEEEAVTAEEEVKSAEADANGFVIKDGVLTDYIGDGGDVTIPDGVTSIGDFAFQGCKNITSITIPASVSHIGYNNVFFECNNLTEINVSEENKNYTSEEGILYNVSKSKLIKCPARKTGSVIIPDDVTSIEQQAFRECSSLTSIIIPDSVTDIGLSAFSCCSSLNDITIPNSVVSIGQLAFSNCSSLRSITIPDSVTSIGDSAFSNCSSLNDITIPNSVTSIGMNAFTSCHNLTAINVSENNKNYTSEDGILYNVSKSTLIQCPEKKNRKCDNSRQCDEY